MPQLVNTDLDSFSGKSLSVHVVYTSLSQNITYFMSVDVLITIGIQIGN